MELSEQYKKEQVFLMKLYQKAWADPHFKAQLLEQPIKTLNRFLAREVQFPEGYKLVVEDQTNENHIYFNIPAKPTPLDRQLHEDDLEEISGGTIGKSFIILTALLQRAMGY